MDVDMCGGYTKVVSSILLLLCACYMYYNSPSRAFLVFLHLPRYMSCTLPQFMVEIEDRKPSRFDLDQRKTTAKTSEKTMFKSVKV